MYERDALEQLRDASFARRTMSDTDVLEGISAVLELWRGSDGYAVRAAHELAAETGQSEDMLRSGLDRMLNAHSPDGLLQWVTDSRVEAARRIATEHPEGEAPSIPLLRGPKVMAQVLAGNVAGLALPATLEALLARSTVLLKSASGDPIIPRLFKESLAHAAPALGKAVAVRAWQGGDEKVEGAVFEQVDYVVASGGREMERSLSRRLKMPHRIHGPRITIGVVGMAWHQAPGAWWENMAREIVLWDQLGCLSPRILFVAGDPKRFAWRLADALVYWQNRWPARPLASAEASAVHGFRSLYQMADGNEAGCIDPEDTSWTVVWDSDPTLDSGPPHRVVRVTRRIGIRAMKPLLTEHHGEIQGMGTDHLASHELNWRRLAEWGGIPWVASLTAIQDPPAGWRADGRSGLVDLLVQGAMS